MASLRCSELQSLSDDVKIMRLSVLRSDRSKTIDLDREKGAGNHVRYELTPFLT